MNMVANKVSEKYKKMLIPDKVVETARAYRYRLYPDSKRQKEIDEQIELARHLLQ